MTAEVVPEGSGYVIGGTLHLSSYSRHDENLTQTTIQHMSETAAKAMIETARLTHAVPAEEGTKQSAESTRQSAEKTKQAQERTKRGWQETARFGLTAVVVAGGVVAMIVAPSAAWPIAAAIGVLGAPTAIEKLKKKATSDD